MRSNGRLGAVALAATVLLLAVGLFELLALRFARGDVYPPYSSLRTDALGTAVLYEAIARLDGVRAVRNVDPVDRLAGGVTRDTTLLVLGIDDASLAVPDPDLDALESIAVAGARVVLTLLPAAAPDHSRLPRKQRRTAKPGGEEDPSERMQLRPLAQRWGLKLAWAAIDDQSGRAVAVASARAAPAEPSISWNSALIFDATDAWRTLYARSQHPVIIERNFGRGSIVLSSDSFFVSNEAMREERRPQLLMTLLGSPSRVVFDETHLGIAEKPGVAALARRYRIHGLLAGFLLLAALHVWRQASPFLPPHVRSAEGDAMISGKDSIAGLINLLRRNLRPSGVLAVCLAEWRRSNAHGGADATIALTQADRLARGEKGSLPAPTVVEAYRRIAEILNPPRRKRGTRS